MPLALLLLTLTSATIGEDPAYLQGIALYRDVEFEQALFRFQSVAVRTDLDDAERAELFFWMGLCYANIGDIEASRRHFKDGLILMPDAPLPEPMASPVIIEAFNEVKAELRAALPGETSPGTASDAAADANAVNPDALEETAPDGELDASPAEEGGLPWILISGGAVAAIGAVTLVGAAAAGGTSLLLIGQAAALNDDPNAFGSDIKAGELQANIALGVAYGLAGLGVLVLVGGVATAGASFALE